jgi:hypothetical protein
MLGAFVEYAPNFKGPVPPEAAVKDIISVIEKASVKTGDGGSFVSHYGNQQWLEISRDLLNASVKIYALHEVEITYS